VGVIGGVILIPFFLNNISLFIILVGAVEQLGIVWFNQVGFN
jgi:hypothetical protein